MASWIGPAISAFGALKQGQDSAGIARANAATYVKEGNIASAQGYEAEAAQRRKTASILGAETAATGQAGAGYGGSVGRSLKQSATNAELDALNIRYKSQLQRWGYINESQGISAAGDVARSSGNLRAGAALLRGYSGNYVGNDLG